MSKRKMPEDYVSLKVTRWSHEQLKTAADALVRAVAERPDEYPFLAGRRLTLSDVVSYLSRRYVCES